MKVFCGYLRSNDGEVLATTISKFSESDVNPNLDWQ